MRNDPVMTKNLSTNFPNTQSTQCGGKCDRGWIIVFACSGVYIIMIGFVKCFGILFVEFLAEFDTTASTVSMVFGLTAASTSIVSLLVPRVLMKYFSLRTIALLGALSATIGVTISYWATSIYFFLLSFSFFVGCGQGLIYCPGMVLISLYFNERRSLATAIATSGVSIGGYLHDVTGTYTIPFSVMGGTQIIGVLFLAAIPMVKRRTAPS